MTPFLKKSSRCWFITVTTRERTYVRLSSGTRDKDVATSMQDMLTALSRRGSREWDLIDAIVEKRIKIERVYDFYPAKLDDLRALLTTKAADPDLAPAIDAWDADLDQRVKAGDLAIETVRHYRRQVNAIFPFAEPDEAGGDELGTRLPVLKSTLTPAFFKGKLAALGGSGTNKRRHAAAWASCLSFLVEHEQLERNPLADVKVPKNNRTKAPYIERLDDVIRFVQTMPEGPHRAAAAMREGAGVELQAMLATRKRDIVDVANRVIWAHGRKNEYRDRQVVVDEWAWSILMAYVKATPMHPDALLFPGVSERNHRAICYAVRDALRAKGVNIPANYRPHHARDTWAVRFMKDGRDPVLGANNEGHSDVTTFLRKYAKFRPAVTDLIRADRRGKKEG